MSDESGVSHPSDGSHCWKYWNQAGNCWQYIDLDEFYGQDDPWNDDHLGRTEISNQAGKVSDWPSLTVVDLLDSDHFRHSKVITDSSEGVLAALEETNNYGKKSLSSRMKTRQRHGLTTSPVCHMSLQDNRLRTPSEAGNYEDLSKNYDIKNLNQKLPETKSDPFPLSQITKPRKEVCEKTWESSLRAPTVAERVEVPVPVSKLGLPANGPQPTGRKPSKVEGENLGPDQNLEKVWLKLVWKPGEKSEKPENEKPKTTKPNLNSVSLMDQFNPTAGNTGAIIHSPSPISATKRIQHAHKVKTSGIGYAVEPITGTGVRPPTELENFRCEPNLEGRYRPETPVEIKRLRLLPTPVVRKCMAEAVKKGMLELEDTELIMKRIKNEKTEYNSETDEEIIKNQSKRLISPLKYMRRPRPDGGPIYKLDEYTAKSKIGQKVAESEPITFKVLSRTETTLNPTHLEIPFLQNKTNKCRRVKTATWQSTLRSMGASAPKTYCKKPVPFEGIRGNPIQEASSQNVISRPIPPPPSPIKNLFSAIPDIYKSDNSLQK